MKKLLSIMLSILMVVTMLPMAVMPASAAENESDGVIYCELGPWAGSLTALKLRYSSDNSTTNDIVMEEVDHNIWKADLSTNNPAGWIVQFLGSNQSAELSSEGTTIPEGKNCFRITEYNSSSGMYDGVWYQYPCTSHEYKDGICPCGYECPHEGQNGSCEICGANLGKLVIDVTDKSSVKIGTGREYYDEDGYIITGTNQNTDVYIYESADLTLKNAVFSRLFMQYALEDSVINITLDGTTEVELVDVYKAHLIFDGGETDTLKTPSFNTSGNPGSVTVNGGNIILDCVTESTLPTIICAGGFIINGGTVTASNNYYNVVFDSVTLNGGELNIISTSTYYEAIMGSIIIEKGALLTVSATKGILDMDSDIVMADDAEENDYFFVRYDTESEFVPVQDINSALDGKTYAEIKIDTHEHSYTDGICDCGYVCLHVNFADGICPDCTASGKLVAIKMSDSNNDGWYGKNAVVIKQLVDGAFEEVETATLTDGKSGTVAVNLDKDGIYVITWQSDYFSNECGFEIYVDGECVYSISDARGIENNAILYTICEHTGGKADCLHKAVCENCGNEYGEVDADGHIMEDKWSWHSSEQHMRGCTICHTSASYEYEDHYGGSATCSTLAICEGCGQSYGEYAADVHTDMSDWKPYSTEQHHRYCLDCGYGTEFADHVEPDNIEDIPCTEDALCKECGEKISSGYKHGPFEWKPYDSYQHQYVCDGCDGVTDYEPHNFIDSVCDTCGYECPHESYTDGVCDVCNYLCPHSFTEFTETVAPKCEEPGWEESYCDYCSIKLEQEIPALDHDWVSGGIERPYQNIDGSWTDGYYYDTCKNDGTHINITGVAKRADYSAYDEAYKSLKAAQKNANLTNAGAAAVNQAVMTGMTMPQNIVEGESTTAYLNNWVKNAQSILAKIENGEYLKADYTEIDEAIASVDTALENASISDEMTEELEDIKADLEALKENENATMADVNALLDRTEAIAETMNNCANGVHSFTKYEEVTAPKCGVAGKEAAICDNGCGVTDEREIPALTHSFTKYEEVTAPKCGVAGKEAATCDNGCGVTDEKEIPALTHKDADGDYKCDYGCGHEFEKPAEPEDPSANCDHLCHSNNWFVKNIIWKIVKFFWKLFKMNPVCECGAAHY